MVDERTGLVHDYTKKGGVLHAEIISKSDLNIDRNTLWNEAERAEKRKDARTAREWRIALPSELNKDQQKKLTQDFTKALVERYNVVADLAIHAPDKKSYDRNYHAHILVTTRQAEFKEGQLTLGNKASIELSDTQRRKEGLSSGADEVTAIRQLWEQKAMSI